MQRNHWDKDPRKMELWEILERDLNVILLEDGEGPVDEEDIPYFDALFGGAMNGLEQGLRNRHSWHTEVVLTGFFIISAASTLGLAWATMTAYRLSARLVRKYRRPSYYNAEALKRAKKNPAATVCQPPDPASFRVSE